eukprot:6187192-Pleurochrysis_carterae.AAC.1
MDLTIASCDRHYARRAHWRMDWRRSHSGTHACMYALMDAASTHNARRALGRVCPNLSSAGSDINTYRVKHGNRLKLPMLRHLRY